MAIKQIQLAQAAESAGVPLTEATISAGLEGTAAGAAGGGGLVGLLTTIGEWLGLSGTAAAVAGGLVVTAVLGGVTYGVSNYLGSISGDKPILAGTRIQPASPPAPTTQVPGSVTGVPAGQPAPGAGAGSLQLVEVTADPSCQSWPGECTSNPNGGQITQYHDYGGGNFFKATYQWNDPPSQVSPEGFTITMDVSAQSSTGPNSSLVAGMSLVGGGFELDRGGTTATFQVLSEKGKVKTGNLEVKVKPPKNPAGDYYLKIGANYYAGFVYHYLVVR